MIDIASLPKRVFDNGSIRIEALTTAGPRITHLSAFGSSNLLAALDAEAKETTSYGDYHFMGGHRLWHAPEAMPRSYLPDDDGLTTEDLPDGIRLMQPAEPGSGIAKTIEIHLPEKGATATLVHTLRNDGLWPVELAPWALTMFRLEGTVILPQPPFEKGMLPNRILAIWPYTNITDPRLILRDDYILVKSVPSGLPAVKIGYYNPHGWLAYWLDGVLFRKTFDLHPNATYPDGGCNTECYSNLTVELEALGPLQKLAPGASVTLTETWELFPSINQPFLTPEIQALLTQ
jgi:hypothetical protein